MKKRELKARFGITMSPDLLEKIDQERGLIPRATYIEHCLKQYFKLRDKTKAFYDELLNLLPERITEKDVDHLQKIIEDIRSKIRQKKIEISPQMTL